jgi:hypothetical protein
MNMGLDHEQLLAAFSFLEGFFVEMEARSDVRRHCTFAALRALLINSGCPDAPIADFGAVLLGTETPDNERRPFCFSQWLQTVFVVCNTPKTEASWWKKLQFGRESGSSVIGAMQELEKHLQCMKSPQNRTWKCLQSKLLPSLRKSASGTRTYKFIENNAGMEVLHRPLHASRCSPL